MKTKNLEKEFRIEVIASLLENRLLNYEKSEYIVTEKDLYSLCSFISGENVNKKNFYELGAKIRLILLELHPELSMKINLNDNNLYDIDIECTLNNYINVFGTTYNIKSIKKCLVKSLRIQDK